jgi:hypothetical protein
MNIAAYIARSRIIHDSEEKMWIVSHPERIEINVMATIPSSTNLNEENNCSDVFLSSFNSVVVTTVLTD